MSLLNKYASNVEASEESGRPDGGSHSEINNNASCRNVRTVEEHIIDSDVFIADVLTVCRFARGAADLDKISGARESSDQDGSTQKRAKPGEFNAVGDSIERPWQTANSRVTLLHREMAYRLLGKVLEARRVPPLILTLPKYLKSR